MFHVKHKHTLQNRLTYLFLALGIILSMEALIMNHAKADQQSITQFCNPLDVLIADPFVLKDGDLYYLYGTSAPGDGYHVWTSPDLVNWWWRGFAFRKTADSWGRYHFWAPEVLKWQGNYLLFYSAHGETESLRLGLAGSRNPLGPFVDVKTPIFESDKAWIDASPFVDTDGKAYLYFVKDVSENPQSEIYVAEMQPQLEALKEPFTFCMKPEGGWEGNSWTEAPFVLKHKNVYYLMYSGSFYGSSSYAIGYATATSPLGPWTKHPGNPILRRTDKVSGPGHNSVVKSPDGTEMFIVYHTHQSFAGGGARQLAIDRLRFVEQPEGSDTLEVVGGPSVTPQDIPSGAPGFSVGRSDDFSAPELDRSLWTIFNEDPTKWRLQDGNLVIQTQRGMVYETNANLRNLFLQYAPEGDFLVETHVDYTAVALYDQAFLMIWQDHNNYIHFGKTRGASGEVYFCGIEKDGEFSSYSSEEEVESVCSLRIVRKGNHYGFYGSADGSNWDILGSGYEVDFPQPKIGLGASSPYSGSVRDATFDGIKVLGPDAVKPITMMTR